MPNCEVADFNIRLLSQIMIELRIVKMLFCSFRRQLLYLADQ